MSKEHINILFFKTKNRIFDGDIHAQSDQDNEAEKEVFVKAFDRWVKRLEKAKDKENYDELYINGLVKLSTYFAYPEYKLSSIGYIINHKTYMFEPIVKTIEEVKAQKEYVLTNFYSKCEGITECDFAINFLNNYAEDGEIWLTTEIVEEALDYCNKALAKKGDAKQLLPTESDDYGKEYVSNVRKFAKLMRHAKSLMNKNYLIYCVAVRLTF